MDTAFETNCNTIWPLWFDGSTSRKTGHPEVLWYGWPLHFTCWRSAHVTCRTHCQPIIGNTCKFITCRDDYWECASRSHHTFPIKKLVTWTWRAFLLLCHGLCCGNNRHFINIFFIGATRQIWNWLRQTLQNWADGFKTTQTLCDFITNIPSF